MITGHLQEKKGRYYMVINLKDSNGNWKPKWKATGLPIKGNKKRAEEILRKTIREYEKNQQRQEGNADNIYLADYLEGWLTMMKNSIEETTYTSYHHNVVNVMCPFFKEIGVHLSQ